MKPGWFSERELITFTCFTNEIKEKYSRSKKEVQKAKETLEPGLHREAFQHYCFVTKNYLELDVCNKVKNVLMICSIIVCALQSCKKKRQKRI